MSASHDSKFPKLYRMKLLKFPESVDSLTPMVKVGIYAMLGEAPDGHFYRVVGIDPEAHEAVYYIEKEDRR
jgi:hypothetical protein